MKSDGQKLVFPRVPATEPEYGVGFTRDVALVSVFPASEELLQFGICPHPIIMVQQWNSSAAFQTVVWLM